jgi:hypothetical protein
MAVMTTASAILGASSDRLSTSRTHLFMYRASPLEHGIA